MNKNSPQTPASFDSLVEEIPHIGFKVHVGTLLRQAQDNQPFVKRTIKDISLKGKKAESAIVISAGPSLHRRKVIRRILDLHYQGTIVAVDGAYIACLREGLYPDFVVTLDPNHTRVVRWFGDPDFEEHSRNDDYFARQDLDVEFRKNSIEHNQRNIKFVNEFGHLTKAVIATCSSMNVVNRVREAKMEMYWWNPLVDGPSDKDSITKRLFAINKIPCMNTGGNVGTAAWVFAATRLNVPRVALTGMDLGYYHDTPFEETQTYYELIDRAGSVDGIERFFVECVFPLTGEKFYTDPTYFWYRQNLLELLDVCPDNVKNYNCTEAGTLFADKLPCISLDEFINTTP